MISTKTVFDHRVAHSATRLSWPHSNGIKSTITNAMAFHYILLTTRRRCNNCVDLHEYITQRRVRCAQYACTYCRHSCHNFYKHPFISDVGVSWRMIPTGFVTRVDIAISHYGRLTPNCTAGKSNTRKRTYSRPATALVRFYRFRCLRRRPRQCGVLFWRNGIYSNIRYLEHGRVSTHNRSRGLWYRTTTNPRARIAWAHSSGANSHVASSCRTTHRNPTLRATDPVFLRKLSTYACARLRHVRVGARYTRRFVQRPVTCLSAGEITRQKPRRAPRVHRVATIRV